LIAPENHPRRPGLQDYVRVGVTVSFLRMTAPPEEPAPALPEGVEVVHVRNCTVSFYRYLYNTIGAEYVWWLRRTVGDAQIERLLRDGRVGIWAAYKDGEPAGFYELDSTQWPAVNLSYFGLMPHAIGSGMGYAFLRHAVDAVWRSGARAMTVNTCTADHPRALPTYKRAGFRVMRDINELWEVPKRLGLVIPERLILR
jgi:hypothetical protein